MIRYISRPPIPQIESDWFPARYVKRLYKGSDLRRQIRDELKAKGVNLNPKIIARSVRKVVLKAWEEGGLREWARGDTASSQQKAESFARKAAKASG